MRSPSIWAARRPKPASFSMVAPLTTGHALIGGYDRALPVQVPTIDIFEVGTGGGSIARVEHGGALHVGPQSAGAEARSRLLRARRQGTDDHRRQSVARAPGRRPLSWRRDEARFCRRRERHAATDRRAARAERDRRRQRHLAHSGYQDVVCGQRRDHGARARRRQLRPGRLWRRGSAACHRGCT